MERGNVFDPERGLRSARPPPAPPGDEATRHTPSHTPTAELAAAASSQRTTQRIRITTPRSPDSLYVGRELGTLGRHIQVMSPQGKRVSFLTTF